MLLKLINGAAYMKVDSGWWYPNSTSWWQASTTKVLIKTEYVEARIEPATSQSQGNRDKPTKDCCRLGRSIERRSRLEPWTFILKLSAMSLLFRLCRNCGAVPANPRSCWLRGIVGTSVYLETESVINVMRKISGTSGRVVQVSWCIADFLLKTDNPDQCRIKSQHCCQRTQQNSLQMSTVISLSIECQSTR